MKKAFLRHADTNLFLLPSIHYAPEFFSLALQGDLKQFDILCLELPATWPVAAILNHVNRIRPALGLTLMPCTRPTDMEVPLHPGSRETLRRRVRGAACLPVVSDSIVSLLWLARASLTDWRPRIYFVDAAPRPGFMTGRFGDSPDGAPFRALDPQDVLERGMPTWVEKIQPYLAQVQPDPDFGYRNQVMAGHLRSLMDQYPHRRILFVCGASHAVPVGDLLQAPASAIRREPLPAATVPEIHSGWISGDSAHLLGSCDLPCAMADFEQRLAQGQVEYRRQAALDEMLKAALDAVGPRIPPRSVLNFQNLLEKMLRVDGRRSPFFEEHILSASDHAIKSPTFSLNLWEMAMRYKLLPADPRIPQACIIPGLEPGLFFIHLGSEYFYIRQPVHSGRQHIRRMFYWRPGRADVIDKRSTYRGGASMNPPAEERLLKWICEEARSRAHQLQRAADRSKPYKFKGEFRGRPDWRRTVWTRTRGQSNLYLTRNGSKHCNQTCLDCAVVFLLEPDRAHRHAPIADWWRDERPAISRLIYANFLWFAGKSFCNGIRENQVAIRVRLYRKLPAIYDKATIYKLLDDLPRDKLCACPPWEDPELQRFRDDPASLALAGAVKWTVGDHVTVVAAQPASHVGEEISQYAAERGVRLNLLSTYQFRDPLIFERFAIDSEVPVRGPWTPPEPADICRCRAVPGFDDQ